MPSRRRGRIPSRLKGLIRMMRTPFQYLGLALALSGSVAFPQDKPQAAASSPLPERPVVTEQVLIHEGLPKLVRYSASVPLASLKSYVRLISKGRAALVKSAKSSGFTWPDGLEAGSTSPPALALMSGWESIKGEAKGAKTWVQLDFDLTMEGGLSNVKALVIERAAKGTSALARESEECKRAEAALSGEGRPKNLTVQNSRRNLLVADDSTLWVGDHFPVGTSAHPEDAEGYCWRISRREQGSYLGLEGLVYTLQAATLNKEVEFHKPEEELERKFLGGIGFIQ